MTTYEKYKNSGITLECAGFDERGDNIPYFCTPVGAQILGRPGVDGIHFCFVPEYDEMVFAISPMNGAEDCIHVVSRTFADFLSILMSCGDTAAVEQAWQWSREQFENFLVEYPPTDEAKSVLAQLEQKLGIAPMPDLYGYMTALQKDFDYSKITFSEEYYDILGIPMPE